MKGVAALQGICEQATMHDIGKHVILGGKRDIQDRPICAACSDWEKDNRKVWLPNSSSPLPDPHRTPFKQLCG